MKRIVILIAIFFAPIITKAADLPDVINTNKQASDQMCIDRETDDCVKTTCVNSPKISCNNDCKNIAESKCKGMNQ